MCELPIYGPFVIWFNDHLKLMGVNRRSERLHPPLRRLGIRCVEHPLFNTATRDRDYQNGLTIHLDSIPNPLLERLERGVLFGRRHPVIRQGLHLRRYPNSETVRGMSGQRTDAHMNACQHKLAILRALDDAPGAVRKQIRKEWLSGEQAHGIALRVTQPPAESISSRRR